MADEPATGAEPSGEPQQQPEAPRNEEPKDTPLGTEGEKALDIWKQRAKEAEKVAKDARAALEAREEAEKSDLEKAQGKVQKAEGAKAEAEAKLLRYEVASEKEIPAKLVPLLTATDREGLEAQADLILENAPKQPENPDFGGGAREPAPENKTPEEEHNALIAKLFTGDSTT